MICPYRCDEESERGFHLRKLHHDGLPARIVRLRSCTTHECREVYNPWRRLLKERLRRLNSVHVI